MSVSVIVMRYRFAPGTARKLTKCPTMHASIPFGPWTRCATGTDDGSYAGALGPGTTGV